MGNAGGGLIIGYTSSWESPFYVFGVSGIIWFVFWLFLGFSEPRLHPYLSETEKKYLEDELSKEINPEDFILIYNPQKAFPPNGRAFPGKLF